jgi:hypothetical protein
VSGIGTMDDGRTYTFTVLVRRPHRSTNSELLSHKGGVFDGLLGTSYVAGQRYCDISGMLEKHTSRFGNLIIFLQVDRLCSQLIC